MESCHTPGPWKIRTDKRTVKITDENGNFIATVLNPNKYGIHGNTQQADATLIMSVPDLLEALEAMSITFGTKSYMTRDLDPEITTEAVLIKARNAIIKAKGLPQ